jgi:hypothetical protein
VATRDRATDSLGGLLCQEVDCRLLGLAVGVLEQGGFEDGVVGGRGHEQGQAGPEFEMVGITKR